MKLISFSGAIHGINLQEKSQTSHEFHHMFVAIAAFGFLSLVRTLAKPSVATGTGTPAKL